MTEYADIKLKRLRNFIKHLSHRTNIKLERGGGHVDKITYPHWARPFPLPSRHGTVNKHIVKDLLEKLINDEITNQEEIDKKL
ncbi:MAG: hypothetical protein WCV73_02335 [Patescibacteria group bacterium]|jgi:hypothetical protein